MFPVSETAAEFRRMNVCKRERTGKLIAISANSKKPLKTTRFRCASREVTVFVSAGETKYDFDIPSGESTLVMNLLFRAYGRVAAEHVRGYPCRIHAPARARGPIRPLNFQNIFSYFIIATTCEHHESYRN